MKIFNVNVVGHLTDTVRNENHGIHLYHLLQRILHDLVVAHSCVFAKPQNPISSFHLNGQAFTSDHPQITDMRCCEMFTRENAYM